LLTGAVTLLRLPTTGSREHQQIRQALDNAEAHWARLSTRWPPDQPAVAGRRSCPALAVAVAVTVRAVDAAGPRPPAVPVDAPVPLVRSFARSPGARSSI